MAIPSNVVIVWTGANASIPTGYTRETTLDGVYPRGCASGATTGGLSAGFNTHIHTASAHTHTITTGAPVESMVAYSSTGAITGNSSSHGHAAVASGAASGVAWATGSSEPYAYHIIFIKSGGTNDIPKDAVVLTDANPGGDFVFCDGGSSTPNLASRWLRGASTNADAGTTYAGVHKHDDSDGHTHAAVTLGKMTESGVPRTNLATRGNTVVISTHAHTGSLGSSGVTTLDNQSVTVPFANLYCYQNQGSEQTLNGMIGLWLGTRANIPVYWSEVTSMRDTFIKNTDASGTALSSGAGASHSHTQSSHTHTATISSSGATCLTGTTINTMPAHTHAVSSVSSETITTASEQSLPAYITAFYIKYSAPLQMAQVIMCTE
jgi:hypothetical protein